MEEPIDDQLLEIKADPLRHVISWWEKKRLIYNLAVVAMQLFYMIVKGEETIGFGIVSAIIGSLAFLFVANLFYCIGWGTEMLLVYYLKTGTENNAGRLTFFILGIVFSVYLTFGMYASSLGSISVNPI